MVELKAGAMRCEVEPAMGGCLAGLWLQDIPVLRPPPPEGLASARQSGGYPLVPYSNRIGQARLEWEGTLYALVRAGNEEPHAIHGIGWQRPWSVLEQDERSLMLAYEHKPDSHWPFAFDCSHTFRLRETALELTLALTNQSQAPAPAGLGWHPWFMKRSRSRISFEATGRWEMGNDKLPTARKPAHGLDADCAFLDVDHCFDGWDGVVHLRDESMHVRLRSSLARLVVFTNPKREHIAIEPVSHVNNAVQLHAGGRSAQELGLRVLAPGETMVAHMSLEVEPAR